MHSRMREYACIRMRRALQEYNPEEWFEYPDAIKKYIEAGRLRGYDGGDIL